MTDSRNHARAIGAWIVLLAVTIGGIVIAGRTDDRTTANVSATLACLLLIGFAVWLNRPFWHGTDDPKTAILSAGAENSLALALAYGWGALAMFGYYLTTIKWYHPWQYGGAMLILAIMWARDIPRLRNANPAFDRRRLARQVNTACIWQAVAVALGIAYLVLSGKFVNERGGWLANRIFLAGGVAVMVISMLTAATYRRLRSTSK